MQADSGVTGLIGKIHHAALDSRRWHDLIAELPALLESHTGIVLPPDAQGSEAVFRYFGLDADVQQVFQTTAAAVQRRHGGFIPFTGSLADGAHLSRQDSATVSLLIPHLRSALACHQRLSRAESLARAATTALEATPFGVVVVDAGGNILHANGQAKSMAARTRLLRVPPGGALRAMRQAEDAPFQNLLQGALRSAGGSTGHTFADGGSLRFGMAGGPQLHALVTPLPASQAAAGDSTSAASAVAVFLSDPQARIGSLALILRKVYGMTPAEALLTEALVNGDTPGEYARARGLSMSTIRSQVRTAAGKAGASRQADLIRIVLTGPAVLRHVG